MKKRIRIIVMVFTMLFGLFGCGSEPQKAITSVESMTLTLRGMRGSSVYTFDIGDNPPELRRYREIYSGGETILELEKSAVCDSHVMIELMNTCTVLRWDGFHGKHPKNVSDGIMFDFTAAVNGGQTIRADGSANFPKGYYEFVRTLNEMLAESETNGTHAQQPAFGLETNPFPTEPLSADKPWKCPACGIENKGKFCAECGLPETADTGWTCSCGTENKRNFCSECGKPRP